MKIRIFIIIAFSFFCSTQNLSAQVFSYFKKIKTLKENRKNNEKKAEIAYKNGDYQTVYETYKKNLQKAKLSPKAQYDYAQVALNLRDYDTAIDLFSKITTKKNEFRFAHYLYGTALKNKGRYQEAITQFGKFLERDTVYMNKNKYAKTAQTHIVGCNEAIKFVEQKTGFQIDTLQKILNTGEGEFAPALYLKQDNGEQSLFFSYSDETIHILKRLTETGEIVKFQGEFGDTGYYTTHASISHDEKQLFFTRCEELSNGDMSCAVYSADIDKYANVSNPVKLNSNVNVEGYSAMSPFLSKNNEGEEILFFASNRVGGVAATIYGIVSAYQMANLQRRIIWVEKSIRNMMK
jgi:tetratricopeptide (TPR) repeat protein